MRFGKLTVLTARMNPVLAMADAKAIRIREIVTGDQLGLDFGGVDFWTDRPVSELIAEAGAEPVENPADLELQGISEDAWAALYEVLGLWPVTRDGRQP